MGFWYLVRKTKSSAGTNERYDCEQIIYEPTGRNTFFKMADIRL